MRGASKEEEDGRFAKLLSVLFFASLAVTGLAVTAFAADDQKLDSRLDAAANVINQIMSTPDKGIAADDIARKATCIAVVPGMVKGAFIFGAEYGRAW